MEFIATLAAIVVPFWKLPMIWRIVQRKSSDDISLSWAIGVWVCFVLMAPSAFYSKDLVWKVFSALNLVLFTILLVCILIYRRWS